MKMRMLINRIITLILEMVGIGIGIWILSDPIVQRTKWFLIWIILMLLYCGISVVTTVIDVINIFKDEAQVN